MNAKQEISNKLSELLRKHKSLTAEIIQNQIILEEYRQDIMMLMKNNDIKIHSSPENKLEIELKTIESTSFNSKKFQKENGRMYESFRFPSKRFDAKKLKKAEPDIYNKYIETSTSESLEIRELKTHRFEELPEID